MTNRLSLALLIGIGMAAPTALAQNDPGWTPAAPSAERAVQVDDRDAGGAVERSVPTPAVNDQDDLLSAVPSVVRIVVTDAALDNGRGSATASLRITAATPSADGALSDGRSLDAAPGQPNASARSAYSGPLDNGRGDAARPSLDRSADTPAEPVSAKTGSEDSDLVLSPVMPNPVRGRAALTFQVDAAGPTTVTVFDLTGRRIATAYDAIAQPDVQTRVELDLAGVAAGTYVAVLDTGRERVSRTFQVVR